MAGMPPPRGASDTLSEKDVETLHGDLVEFIRLERLSGRVLWNFGSYASETKPTTEKMAPDLATIVSNAHLLTVLLRFMPKAKMKDSYFKEVLYRIGQDDPTVNTQSLPLDLFVIWATTKAHIIMSHVKDLKRYPVKFEFRVNKLSAPDRIVLTKLLANVVLCVPHVEKASPAKASMSNSASVSSLESTSPGKDSISSSTTSPPRSPMPPSLGRAMATTVGIQAILDRFDPPKVRPRIQDILDRFDPPKVSQANLASTSGSSSSALLKIACAAPPLPSARGQIRKLCEEINETATKVSKSGVVASLERALKGRIRSTCRVRVPNGKRESWAEVTLAHHPRHEAIVQKVIDAVNLGNLTCKGDASERCTRLCETTTR